MRLPVPAAWALILTALPGIFSVTAAAQHASFLQGPAHLAKVEGAVTLDRESMAAPIEPGMPLVAGDRLLTARGRADVIFGDGSRMYVDDHTTIELLDASLLRLTQGRVLLIVSGSGANAGYRVDTPAASVEIGSTGEYTIALTDRAETVELAVARGAAWIVTPDDRLELRAGERAVAGDGRALAAARFNAAALDGFGQWVTQQRREPASASAAYLPDGLQAYAPILDRHGTWTTSSEHGTVWVPYAAAGWQPYSNGRWARVPHVGLTWIGTEPWSWPTHHFGRWTFRSGLWIWVPRAGWAPAWVHWAVAPGLVAWCPLGPGNFPIVQLPVHGRPDLFRAGGAYSPWFAWTIVSRDDFEASRHLAQRTLGGEALRHVGGFLSQSEAPVAISLSRPAARGLPVPGRVAPGATRPIRIHGARASGRAAAAPVHAAPRPVAGVPMPGPGSLARMPLADATGLPPVTTGAGLPPVTTGAGLPPIVNAPVPTPLRGRGLPSVASGGSGSPSRTSGARPVPRTRPGVVDGPARMTSPAVRAVPPPVATRAVPRSGPTVPSARPRGLTVPAPGPAVASPFGGPIAPPPGPARPPGAARP